MDAHERRNANRAVRRRDPDPVRRNGLARRRSPGGSTATSSFSASTVARSGAGLVAVHPDPSRGQHARERLAVPRRPRRRAAARAGRRRRARTRPGRGPRPRGPPRTATAGRSRPVGRDVRARGRERLEALGIDRLAGDLVDAVRAFVESLQRGLDLGEVGLEPFEDREILLSLEQLRTLVGRVLVVVRDVAGLRGLLPRRDPRCAARRSAHPPGPARARAVRGSRLRSTSSCHAQQGTHPVAISVTRRHASRSSARAGRPRVRRAASASSREPRTRCRPSPAPAARRAARSGRPRPPRTKRADGSASSSGRCRDARVEAAGEVRHLGEEVDDSPARFVIAGGSRRLVERHDLGAGVRIVGEPTHDAHAPHADGREGEPAVG